MLSQQRLNFIHGLQCTPAQFAKSCLPMHDSEKLPRDKLTQCAQQRTALSTCSWSLAALSHPPCFFASSTQQPCLMCTAAFQFAQASSLLPMLVQDPVVTMTGSMHSGLTYMQSKLPKHVESWHVYSVPWSAGGAAACFSSSSSRGSSRA